MTDYYKVLQLTPGASLEEADEQYRFLLRALHPDNFTGADREEQLARAEIDTRLLNEAYDALKEAEAQPQSDWDSLAGEDPQIPAVGSPAYAWGDSQEGTTLEPDEHPLFRMAPPRGRMWPSAGTGPSTRRKYAARGWQRPAVTGVLLLGGIVTVAYACIGLSSGSPAAPASAPERPPSDRVVPALQAAVFARPQPAPRLERKNEPVEEPVHGSRTKQPITADVTLPQGAQMFGAIPVGNIEVIYADGTQDTWTTRGNCGQPRVAADGTVGWTVFGSQNSGSRNTDFQTNGTLILGRRGHLVARIRSSLDHIEDWAFLDNGKTVVLRTRGSAGVAVIERHECSTGRLMDRLSEDGGSLPSWALALSDR